jgi:hypothetical protein
LLAGMNIFEKKKITTMSILNPRGNKGDKKNSKTDSKKNNTQSKFITNKNTKSQGAFVKKSNVGGGSQRGS